MSYELEQMEEAAEREMDSIRETYEAIIERLEREIERLKEELIESEEEIMKDFCDAGDWDTYHRRCAEKDRESQSTPGIEKEEG